MSEVYSDPVLATAAMAERLKASFDRRSRAFSSAARRVRASSDSEAIHDLRVSARRLVAALSNWESLFRARERRLAIQELRGIRRRVGEARELEVHVSLLQPRLSAHGAVTRAAATAVLGRLRERLARRRRRAVELVRPKRLRRLLKLLESAAPEMRTKLIDDPGALGRARRREREWGASAQAAMSIARERADDGSLHEARIAIKKWRYAIECLEEAAPGTASHDVKSLREVQEVLGTIHDRAMLRDLLARFARDLVYERHPDALQPLIDQLEAERLCAVEELKRLAAGLFHSPEIPRVGAPGTPRSGVGGSGAAPRDAARAAEDHARERGAISGWQDPEKDRLVRWLTREDAAR